MLKNFHKSANSYLSGGTLIIQDMCGITKMKGFRHHDKWTVCLRCRWLSYLANPYFYFPLKLAEVDNAIALCLSIYQESTLRLRNPDIP